MNCRICDHEVSDLEWRFHVEDHKRAYCRALGNNPELWYLVNWEDAVFYFNPKNILKKPQGEDVANRIQKTLKIYL
jgi:hypothetical protein